MDKVNLKYVPNSSRSSDNKKNNNPKDVLKVVKTSLQDFLMKFPSALERNSVMNITWRKRISVKIKAIINTGWTEHVFSSTFTI